MHLRPGYFLLLAASLLAPASLRAQQQTLSTPDHQEMDFAATYTEQHSNLVSTPAFWLPGGSVELSAQVYHGLGLAVNVAGNTVTNAANSGVGLSMVTANFGPRFTFYRPAGAGRKRGLAIFGQGLVGQAWGFNSYFPSTSGVHTDYDSFALQIGGGVDVGLSRHFAVRVFQGDWLRTEFPNASTNVQNNFRLAAGIVLRIPQRQQ